MNEDKKIVIGTDAFNAFLETWKQHKAGEHYVLYETVIQFVRGAFGGWKSGAIYPDAGQRCLDVDFVFLLRCFEYLVDLSRNSSSNLNNQFASIQGLTDTITDPDGEYILSKETLKAWFTYLKQTLLTDEEVAQIYEYAMGFTDVPEPDSHRYNAFHNGNSIKVLASEIRGSQPQSDKVIQIIKETFNIN